MQLHVIFPQPRASFHHHDISHELFWFCLQEKNKTRKHLIVWVLDIYSVFKDISSVLFLDHLFWRSVVAFYDSVLHGVDTCVDFDLKRKKKTRFYIHFLNTWCKFWFGDFQFFFNSIWLDLPPLPLMTKCQWPLSGFKSRINTQQTSFNCKFFLNR